MKIEHYTMNEESRTSFEWREGQNVYEVISGGDTLIYFGVNGKRGRLDDAPEWAQTQKGRVQKANQNA